MKTLLVLASLVSFSEGEHPTANMSKIPDQDMKVAVMCFSKGEQLSGMNKICYYDCMGSAAAITIGAAQLCP
ncbi:hypothetical protein, partial [Aestuariivirga sp.]|uniref:hypothetical protein n=1 Tax=Aestuariivirga sp. TaxID=2650926 RepID=UPI003018F198